MLEALGLVWDLRRPSREVIEGRDARDQADGSSRAAA
jgi:hypothetical protein